MLGVFPYSQESGTAMGRLENQLREEVKKQRVKQLMLAQQEIAFAKAAALKGKQIQVLVDRPADSDADDFIARSSAQAPEIDSITLVQDRKLKPGQFLTVEITGANGYDLIAHPAGSRTRRLNVLR